MKPGFESGPFQEKTGKREKHKEKIHMGGTGLKLKMSRRAIFFHLEFI